MSELHVDPSPAGGGGPAERLPSLRGELLHRAIQTRIRHLVLESGLRPGDPLPPETEMAAGLGVSRSSVREAVKALQSAGLVETRHGHGTFVRPFSLDPLLEGWASAIVFEVKRDARAVRQLFELRGVLEEALIGRVIGRHTPADLAELRALAGQIVARARAGQDFVEEDHRFHAVLYRPFGNDLLAQLLEVFFRAYRAVRQQVPTVDRLPHARRHQRIADAAAAGDRAAAVRAVAAHFTPILAMYARMSADPAGAPATPPPRAPRRRARRHPSA